MADIFLSYAEEDRAAARRIVGVLESQGWSVWWDRRIPTGKTWRSVIEDGIRDMRCMVVLWSSHSIDSEWVNEEAEEGRVAAKLMPVLIERVQPPLGLRGIQATDLIDWDGAGDAPSIRQLVSDITAMMQTPGPANVPPAPPHHEDESPPPAAKKTLFRPVWAGALVLAAAAALVLVWRGQPASPVATKPVPPAATAFIPAPIPAPAPAPAPAASAAVLAPVPAAAGPAPVTPEPVPARPVVAQKREPPLAAVVKRGGKRKVDQSRCEAIVQRAQLGTPLGDEDRAFLKRDCQP